MIELEKYFDEDKWREFASLFEENAFVKILAGNLDNDIVLASVIFGILEKQSLIWIIQKIPALDNLTPKECLSEPKLKNRLKECLMRMPQ